jgi:hypothetical protein
MRLAAVFKVIFTAAGSKKKAKNNGANVGSSARKVKRKVSASGRGSALTWCAPTCGLIATLCRIRFKRR